jgi:hypothetical protein
MSDVTMPELETDELLPSGETLPCWQAGASVTGSFDHQVNVLDGNNVIGGNGIGF